FNGLLSWVSMASPHVVDVTDAEFMSVVVEGSQDRPVLVDFWAEWCGPCKQLGPVLEQIVDGLDGRVLLAKVDVDANPVVAGQLGVQSIPAVYLFAGQRPVDRFVGALPKDEIERFLSPHLPEAPASPPEEAPSELAEAEAALRDGDLARARELVDALESGGEHDAKRVALSGRIGLAEMKEGVPDDEDDPDGRVDRYREALTKASENLFEDALETLLALVAEDKSWRDQSPRKAMLRIFEIVGIRSPLADAYRDRLAKLLF
ncbi:MAG: tetratricopeptide repeat protein, partial [Planctomycetota bacterium JB042]